MSKNVSIILSTYNEKLSIEFTIKELVKYLPGVEIVVVDDGSVDRTLEQLQRWQEIDDRVTIVKLSRNWGHQNAFNAGLDVAKGNGIIFMDGDLEDPPEVIPELLKGWAKGFDTVYICR